MTERIIGDPYGSHLIYDFDGPIPGHAWINRLFVPNDQRRNGEGTRLLEQFFVAAR